MVKASGKASRTGGIRPLNEPRPVEVQADEDQRPLSVREGDRWLKVVSVGEHWRVEDEWWRDEPIDRSYFEVLLEDGRRVVIFRDGLRETWFSIRA